jgi:competence protein ComEA
MSKRASPARVADPAKARALVCALAALAALRPLATPAPPPALAPVEVASGCALAAAGSGPGCGCEDVPGDLRLLLDQRIALDRASARDLEALPGIGPSRANAIVRERERGGGFSDAADLARVPGLGPATAARLAPLVAATDPACGAPR